MWSSLMPAAGASLAGHWASCVFLQQGTTPFILFLGTHAPRLPGPSKAMAAKLHKGNYRGERRKQTIASYLFFLPVGWKSPYKTLQISKSRVQNRKHGIPWEDPVLRCVVCVSLGREWLKIWVQKEEVAVFFIFIFIFLQAYKTQMPVPLANLKHFQCNCSVAIICQQITILLNFNVANLRWLYSKFMQLITVIKLPHLQRKQSNPLLQLLWVNAKCQGVTSALRGISIQLKMHKISALF